MRLSVLLALLSLSACGSASSKNIQAINCSGSETPVYSNRFAPTAGGSGVATGADAANGAINSEGGGGVGTFEGDAPADPYQTMHPPPSDPAEPLTAMTMSCGDSVCDPGKVAVEVPPAPSYPTGGPAIGAPAPGASTDDIRPSVELSPPGTVLCVDPPPACPDGQSPQWTSRGEWECTSCDLVVTYGGQYGNYRRCTAAPTIKCPEGEVPTWVFEHEAWECKTTCDNGAYDQHTISGELICVPC